MQNWMALWLLTLGLAASAEALTDKVHTVVSPEEAVLRVRYSPPEGSRQEQIASAREVFASVQKRIAAMDDPRIELRVTDYGTVFRRGKASSSASHHENWFDCELVIRLGTEAGESVWENAMLLAGVVDAVEEIAKKQDLTVVQGESLDKLGRAIGFDVEYRVQRLESIREDLVKLATERSVQAARAMSASANGREHSVDLVLGEVIPASASITAVRYELPYQLRIQESP